MNVGSLIVVGIGVLAFCCILLGLAFFAADEFRDAPPSPKEASRRGAVRSTADRPHPEPYRERPFDWSRDYVYRALTDATELEEYET